MTVANITADGEKCRYGAMWVNSDGDSDDQGDDDENGESLLSHALMTIRNEEN